MCPKWLSFRNTGECSQMFDETVNCFGDIFLHKYALLHIRTTVNKVTKSKSKSQNQKQTSVLMLLRVSWLVLYIRFRPNCFSPSKSVSCLSLQILKWQICTLPTVLQITHVRQGVFMQKDIPNAIYHVVKYLRIFIAIFEKRVLS